MTQQATALLNQALTLPQEDRADLAAALLESIEPTPDTGVEAAWKLEVASRVAALEGGEVETIPWEEIRDRLYARLSAQRAS